MPETLPFTCVVFLKFSLCVVLVLGGGGGGCAGTSSKVVCKMILRVMATSAASILDKDTGGCLKPYHSSALFTICSPCGLCLCWGLQKKISSKVICKMILRVMTTPAASVWDRDTGGCVKPSHSSVLFSVGLPCVFVPVLGAAKGPPRK